MTLNTPSRSLLYRTVSRALILAIVAGSVPVAEASVSATASPEGLATSAPETPPLLDRAFPRSTAASIAARRAFPDVLTPIGEPTRWDNERVNDLLDLYERSGETRLLEDFVLTHPGSAWRGSMLLNVAVVHRARGRISKALSALERAWDLVRGADGNAEERALVDRTLGELADLNARLGRVQRLRQLLSAAEGRDVHGPATEQLAVAAELLHAMESRPEDTLRCGPIALGRVARRLAPGAQLDGAVLRFKASARGTSLGDLARFAAEHGLPLVAARAGRNGPLPVPSIVHWRAGHYSALLEQYGGRYLVDDPVLGAERWIDREAVVEESSGYYLVPTSAPRAGWVRVEGPEADGVWGAGPVGDGPSPNNIKCKDPKIKNSCQSSGCKGLAQYDIHSAVVSLNIVDVPVWYNPPVGPELRFEVTYNQRDAAQTLPFAYSNLGPKWTFNWLSYIQDDPTNPNASVTHYMPGGGVEPYTFDSVAGAMKLQYSSQAKLTRVSGTRWERTMPNGSRQVYAQPDGVTGPGRKVFLTEMIDPQGNTVTLEYDGAKLRFVRPAMGQPLELKYEVTGKPLLVSSVVDGFNRSAQFAYNAAGQLIRITDMGGLASEFSYGSNDFILSLTTPYGTTHFTHSGPTERWIEVTDPLGGKERVKFQGQQETALQSEQNTQLTPPGFVNDYWVYRNTFYWDKRAMALAPGDPTTAHVMHWLHETGSTSSSTLESEKRPLESRIFYQYKDAAGVYVGTAERRTKMARYREDGQLELHQYTYTDAGQLKTYTDPVLRKTEYEYATVTDGGRSAEVLVRVKQGTTNPDIVEERTYKQQDPTGCSSTPFDLPCRIKDAAGKETSFEYEADGRMKAVVTPPRYGLQPGAIVPVELSVAERTTSYFYYASGPMAGRLERIEGPLVPNGAGNERPTTRFTYDDRGRLLTTRAPDGYTVTMTYDNLDRMIRQTYPDTTYEEFKYTALDVEQSRDRLGRWTQVLHDALRRPTITRDPLGRTVQQNWCNCGSLDSLVDGNGHVTSWERDLQGRVTAEVRKESDGTVFTSGTEYNLEGRLKKVTDPRNISKTFTYGLDGQLTNVDYSDQTPGVAITYDTVYPRVLQHSTPTLPIVYTYRTAGTMGAGQVAAVDGPFANDTIVYDYDELGRLKSRTLNSVVLAAYDYDSLGRLRRQHADIGDFYWSHDGLEGRPKEVTYPNQQKTAYNYFPLPADPRLQEIHHKAPSGTTLSKFQYTYDAVGNILTWYKQGTDLSAKTYEFGYDAADQLTLGVLRSTPGGATLARYGYSYDAAGNRTAEQIDNSVTTSSYSHLNRLVSRSPGGNLVFRGTVSEPATVTVQGTPATVDATSNFEARPPQSAGTGTVTVQATDPSGNTAQKQYSVNVSGSAASYLYDAAGNLTDTGTRHYVWDGDSRLVQVLDNGLEVARFVYDSQGRRAQTVTGGGSTTRTYVYDAEDIVEERNAGSSLTTFHGPGLDQPLAIKDGSGVLTYLLADHLGSVIERTSASGAVVGIREYDPYGRPLIGSADSGYAYTGREWDQEVGLYYYRARFYDPAMGRFLSEDPFGFAGGANFYAYVQGNPVGFGDPDGLYAVPIAPPPPLPPPVYVVVAVAAAGFAVGFGIGTVIVNSLPTSPTPMPILPLTPAQEQQKVTEYTQYKKRCGEQPPACLTDPCEILKWKLQRNKDCLRLRADWDNKWFPGRHEQAMRELAAGIKNLEEAIRRRCP